MWPSWCGLCFFPVSAWHIAGWPRPALGALTSRGLVWPSRCGIAGVAHLLTGFVDAPSFTRSQDSKKNNHSSFLLLFYYPCYHSTVLPLFTRQRVPGILCPPTIPALVENMNLHRDVLNNRCPETRGYMSADSVSFAPPIACHVAFSPTPLAVISC